MRNFSLGVGRRDLALFGGATLLALIVTVVWHLFMIEPITAFFPNYAQLANKYILTFIIYGLALLVAVLSVLLARRGAAEANRANEMGRSSMLAQFLVRFGVALEILGLIITPVGLFYATDPTRSVPVGFASFTAIFVGLFLAGIGGNMLAPRRA